jgi:hypothetical protein
MYTPLQNSHRRQPRRWLTPINTVVGMCLMTASVASTAQPLDGVYFLCPDRLISNQLTLEQAALRGCRRLSSDGLSVVEPPKTPAASGVPRAAATASPVLSSPQEQSGSPGVLRVATPAPRPHPSAVSRQRTAPAVPAPGHRQARPPGPEQRARDSDALAILQSELERTLLAQKRLGATPGSPPSQADLHRLRVDENALRREIARIPR